MRYRYLLLIAVLLTASNAASQQQIPNYSFEFWNAEENPEGWITTNVPEFGMPITKSTAASDGQFAVQGEVVDVLGTVIPPEIITGQNFTPGFPYTLKPSALNGFISTELLSGDVAQIDVAFLREGIPVGGGTLSFASNIATPTSFSVPLFFSGDPDMAWISVSINGNPEPTLGSKFIVDNLTFGSASKVNRNSQEIELRINNLSYAKEITFSAASLAQTTIDIVDIHGRIVETIFAGFAQSATVRWPGDRVASGIYLCRVSRPDGVMTRKLLHTR